MRACGGALVLAVAAASLPPNTVLTSDTTWAASSSPYVLAGTLGVASGGTLTLEAGVEVICGAPICIQLVGSLHAEGSSSSPVTFTCEDGGCEQARWITVMSAADADNLMLQHVTFLGKTYSSCGNQVAVYTEYEGSSASLALNISDVAASCVSFQTGGGPAITNGEGLFGLSFRRGKFDKVLFKTEYPRPARMEILDSDIVDSWLTTDSYSVRGLHIQRSSISNSSFSTGCCQGSGGTVISDSTICRSSFTDYNNYWRISLERSTLLDTAVTLDLGGTFEMRECTVSRSHSDAVHEDVLRITGGEGGSLSIEDVQFLGPGSGTALTVGAEGKKAISRCLFDGFQVAVSSTSDSGDFTVSESSFVDIRGSIFINAGRASVEAASNFWGSVPDAELPGRIVDSKDSLSYGEVTYLPTLLFPSTTAPLPSPAWLEWSLDASEQTVAVQWAQADLADEYWVSYDLVLGPTCGHSFSNSVRVAGTSTTLSLTPGMVSDDLVVAVQASSGDGQRSWYRFASGQAVPSPAGSTTTRIPEEAAPNEVSGIFFTDTIWTAGSGPVRVIGTLGVASGATLTMQAGVEVLCEVATCIQLVGTLVVQGSASAPVKFSCTGGGCESRWVTVMDTADAENLRMQHAVFTGDPSRSCINQVAIYTEYEGSEGAPLPYQTLPLLDVEASCVSFTTGGGPAITDGNGVYGLQFQQGNFSRVNFKTDYPRAARISIYSSNIVDGQLIADSYSLRGLHIESSVVVGSTIQLGCCGTDLRILDSTICSSSFTDYNNYWQLSVERSILLDSPLLLNNGGSLHMKESTMSKSDSAAAGELVTLEHVVDLQLVEVELLGSGSGTALAISGEGSKLITRCLFHSFGVAVDSTAAEGSFSVTASSFVDIAGIIFRNTGSGAIQASSNFWGSVEEEALPGRITDGQDSLSYGSVSYLPVLSAPDAAAPAPPSEAPSAEALCQVEWQPMETPHTWASSTVPKNPDAPKNTSTTRSWVSTTAPEDGHGGGSSVLVAESQSADSTDDTESKLVWPMATLIGVLVAGVICTAMLLCLLSPCGLCKAKAERVANDAEVENPPADQQQEEVESNELIEVPRYWRCSDVVAGFANLELVAEDVHGALQRALTSTFKSVSTSDRRGEAMPCGLRVVEVQRIENSRLWRQYTRARQGLLAKRAHKCTPLASRGGEVLTVSEETALAGDLQKKINEVLLWHGTSKTGALAISQEGFKLSRAGSSAGTLYGPGVYMAECSSKSDEYSPGGGDMHCLLLCRAALGETLTLTAGGEAVHAMIRAAIDSKVYDSVLGDREASVGTYREFVVYSEAQVYPEYLIHYTREY